METSLPPLPRVISSKTKNIPHQHEDSRCTSRRSDSSSRSSGASTSEISATQQQPPRIRYMQDPTTEPCATWPEILVHIMSKYMKISFRAAAALAGPQRNVLTHILVHGINGCFELVLRFLEELNVASRDIFKALYQHSQTNQRHVHAGLDSRKRHHHEQKDKETRNRKNRRRRNSHQQGQNTTSNQGSNNDLKQSIRWLLHSIQPAFLSTNRQICVLCCRFIAKVCIDMRSAPDGDTALTNWFMTCKVQTVMAVCLHNHADIGIEIFPVFDLCCRGTSIFGQVFSKHSLESIWQAVANPTRGTSLFLTLAAEMLPLLSRGRATYAAMIQSRSVFQLLMTTLDLSGELVLRDRGRFASPKQLILLFEVCHQLWLSYTDLIIADSQATNVLLLTFRTGLCLPDASDEVLAAAVVIVVDVLSIILSGATDKNKKYYERRPDDEIADELIRMLGSQLANTFKTNSQLHNLTVSNLVLLLQHAPQFNVNVLVEEWLIVSQPTTQTMFGPADYELLSLLVGHPVCGTQAARLIAQQLCDSCLIYIDTWGAWLFSMFATAMNHTTFEEKSDLAERFAQIFCGMLVMANKILANNSATVYIDGNNGHGKTDNQDEKNVDKNTTEEKCRGDKVVRDSKTEGGPANTCSRLREVLALALQDDILRNAIERQLRLYTCRTWMESNECQEGDRHACIKVAFDVCARILHNCGGSHVRCVLGTYEVSEPINGSPTTKEPHKMDPYGPIMSPNNAYGTLRFQYGANVSQMPPNSANGGRMFPNAGNGLKMSPNNGNGGRMSPSTGYGSLMSPNVYVPRALSPLQPNPDEYPSSLHHGRQRQQPETYSQGYLRLPSPVLSHKHVKRQCKEETEYTQDTNKFKNPSMSHTFDGYAHMNNNNNDNNNNINNFSNNNSNNKKNRNSNKNNNFKRHNAEQQQRIHNTRARWEHNSKQAIHHWQVSLRRLHLKFAHCPSNIGSGAHTTFEEAQRLGTSLTTGSWMQLLRFVGMVPNTIPSEIALNLFKRHVSPNGKLSIKGSLLCFAELTQGVSFDARLGNVLNEYEVVLAKASCFVAHCYAGVLLAYLRSPQHSIELERLLHTFESEDETMVAAHVGHTAVCVDAGLIHNIPDMNVRKGQNTDVMQGRSDDVIQGGTDDARTKHNDIMHAKSNDMMQGKYDDVKQRRTDDAMRDRHANVIHGRNDDVVEGRSDDVMRGRSNVVMRGRHNKTRTKSNINPPYTVSLMHRLDLNALQDMHLEPRVVKLSRPFISPKLSTDKQQVIRKQSQHDSTQSSFDSSIRQDAVAASLQVLDSILQGAIGVRLLLPVPRETLGLVSSARHRYYWDGIAQCAFPSLIAGEMTTAKLSEIANHDIPGSDPKEKNGETQVRKLSANRSNLVSTSTSLMSSTGQYANQKMHLRTRHQLAPRLRSVVDRMAVPKSRREKVQHRASRLAAAKQLELAKREHERRKRHAALRRVVSHHTISVLEAKQEGHGKRKKKLTQQQKVVMKRVVEVSVRDKWKITMQQAKQEKRVQELEARRKAEAHDEARARYREVLLVRRRARQERKGEKKSSLENQNDQECGGYGLAVVNNKVIETITKQTRKARKNPVSSGRSTRGPNGSMYTRPNQNGSLSTRDVETSQKQKSVKPQPTSISPNQSKRIANDWSTPGRNVQKPVNDRSAKMSTRLPTKTPNSSPMATKKKAGEDGVRGQKKRKAARTDRKQRDGEQEGSVNSSESSSSDDSSVGSVSSRRNKRAVVSKRRPRGVKQKTRGPVGALPVHPKPGTGKKVRNNIGGIARKRGESNTKVVRVPNKKANVEESAPAAPAPGDKTSSPVAVPAVESVKHGSKNITKKPSSFGGLPMSPGAKQFGEGGDGTNASSNTPPDLLCNIVDTTKTLTKNDSAAVVALMPSTVQSMKTDEKKVVDETGESVNGVTIANKVEAIRLRRVSNDLDREGSKKGDVASSDDATLKTGQETIYNSVVHQPRLDSSEPARGEKLNIQARDGVGVLNTSVGKEKDVKHNNFRGGKVGQEKPKNIGTVGVEKRKNDIDVNKNDSNQIQRPVVVISNTGKTPQLVELRSGSKDYQANVSDINGKAGTGKKEGIRGKSSMRVSKDAGSKNVKKSEEDQ